MSRLPLDDLVRACHALTLLVKSEYPDGYSISEIAAEWGPDPEVGLSQDDIDAVARVAPLITG